MDGLRGSQIPVKSTSRPRRSFGRDLVDGLALLFGVAASSMMSFADLLGRAVGVFDGGGTRRPLPPM